jgi:hypothetical protein
MGRLIYVTDHGDEFIEHLPDDLWFECLTTIVNVVIRYHYITVEERV